MDSTLKTFVKAVTPPVVASLYKKLTTKYGFSGEYDRWEDARRDSDGYESDTILARVKEASLKVKRGEAAYERDSVLFDRTDYSWPLLSSLLWIASSNDNRLHVVDFGGSLGTSYYQNRRFLTHVKELEWNIVEQKKFVECGKESFADNHLKFFEALPTSLGPKKPSVILMSSVLPYVERPYELLDRIIGLGFEYIIIDRTLSWALEDDRLSVQRVNPRIYEASYPCWILSEGKILRKLSTAYNLIESFDAHSGAEISIGNASARYRGFLHKRKTT